MPPPRQKSPLFLKRCLRPISTLGWLLRGSTTAVVRCRPVEALTIHDVSVSPPRAGGSFVGGAVVAFSPRLSSKLTVRYSVLGTGYMRLRPGQGGGDRDERIDLSQPMVLRCLDGDVVGEIILVAVLCIRSMGSPSFDATLAVKCVVEQFAAFGKAKPPLNMQLAVRSRMKACGVGACALEFCVAGRFVAGDVSHHEFAAPERAVLHSRLLNALSGLARSATDHAEDSDPMQQCATPAAAGAVPPDPTAAVSIAVRPSFRNPLLPQFCSLSPRAGALLKRLSAMVSSLASALPSAVPPRSAGDKRPREPASGISGPHPELLPESSRRTQVLVEVLQLLCDAVGACLLPTGASLTAVSLARIEAVLGEFEAHLFTGSASLIAARSRPITALASEARADMLQQVWCLRVAKGIKLPCRTCWMLLQGTAPCGRPHCMFSVQHGGMAPGGALFIDGGLFPLANPRGEQLPLPRSLRSPVQLLAPCPCVFVRRRAWLTARKSVRAHVACVPGEVRDPQSLLRPWLAACETALSLRAELRTMLTSLGGDTRIPSRNDAVLERLVAALRATVVVQPTSLPTPAPHPPSQATTVVGLTPPPISQRLSHLFVPKPPRVEVVAQRAEQRPAGGSTAGSTRDEPARAYAQVSRTCVPFIAMPHSAPFLRAPPTLELLSPPGPAASSPDDPSSRPSPGSAGGGAAARSSVSVAAAVQAALEDDGASLSRAFDAALRRGTALPTRRSNPFEGESARTLLPPAGRFIHSATGIPVTQAEAPVDSEDEVGHEALTDESAARLRALDDVAPADKAVMLMWNGFAAKRVVYSAAVLPQACVLFVREHRAALRRLGLRAALLRLLSYLWDTAALSAESIAACMAALDEGIHEGSAPPGFGLV